MGCSSSSSAGVPMSPPTPTLRPASAIISPTRVVTVLLPLEPVMAMTGVWVSRTNSSMSPTMRTPNSAAAFSSGGRQGDTRTRHYHVRLLEQIAVAAVNELHLGGKLPLPGGSARVSITRGVTPRPRK